MNSQQAPVGHTRTLTDGLGRSFALQALLGEGGFGEVYLARMTSPGGRCASDLMVEPT